MQSSKFKTCIINGQEQYAFAQIVGGSPMMTELAAQMFPEALLSFVDLDMGNVSELILAMNTCVISVADIADKGYQGEFLRILEALAQQHIYFELFRLEWIDRIQQARSANILKRHWRNEKVRYLPKVLEDIQRQIKDMFKYVLDYDSGNGTALEKAASYYKKTDEPIFSFRPLLMHFEFWHNDTFAEVVYPESIYDLISYHLQECIRRGLRLRVCRNCGRYFHMSGRNTAVYCCRPYGEKGHICRKMQQHERGRKRIRKIQYSMNIAENTRDASPGSMPERLSGMIFMHGVNRPGKRRRNARQARYLMKRLPNGFVHHSHQQEQGLPRYL